jgi:two-component sensor histidine kinase/ABC-type amino acid transport substrate-binding protein
VGILAVKKDYMVIKFYWGKMITGIFVILVSLIISATTSVAHDGSKEKQSATISLDLTEEQRIWIESHRTVKVVHYFHQPPFTIDTDHSHTGYLYELLFEVLNIAGMQPELIEGFSTYDSMIKALQNGEVDILTNLNSTRRLADSIERTVPVVKTPFAVIAKIHVPEITLTSDLFDKKVAVVKGFAQDRHLDKFPRINKVHVKNNQEGFEAVRMGRAEYFLNNMANSSYVLKKTFATDLHIAGTLSYTDFPPLTLSFGVHGKDSPLPAIIHKALAAMPVSTLSQLQESWLLDEPTTKDTVGISLTPAEQTFLKEHPVINIGGPKAFPPFQFLSEGNEFQGMATDYIQIIAKTAGFKVRINKNLPWPDVLNKMKNKDLDLLTCAAISSEREKFMKFSTPYLSFPLVIISRDDASFISGLEDLRNKKVAFIKKVTTYEWIKRDNINVTPVFVDSPLDALNAISHGRADATIQNLASAVYLMKKNNIVNLKVAAPTNYSNYKLAFAVRDDWPELVSILNKGLLAIEQSTHDTIRNKWISSQYEYGISKTVIIKWISIIIGFAGLIVFFIMLWNRRLAIEIAERKQAEKDLSQSLQDKDMLMSEIHHRVKNNFAVIQSLLTLQLREITDEKSKEYFDDAQNRIRSMTMIHEMLQDSDDLRHMNTKRYIETLITMLSSNYKTSEQAIKLQYNIEDISLDVDTMIPLGLIINELVSNALKYAFPNNTEGELSVSLKDTGQNNYELIISDTGIGLAKDLDIKNVKSLGLRIVDSLIVQIEGTLEVLNNDGAEFRISFIQKTLA